MARKKKKEEKKNIPYIKLITGLIFMTLSVFSLIPNTFGLVGKVLNSTLVLLFGNLAFLISLLILYVGIYLILKRKRPDMKNIVVLGVIFMIFSVIVLYHLTSIRLTVGHDVFIKEAFNNFNSNFSNMFKGYNVNPYMYGILGLYLIKILNVLIQPVGTIVVSVIIFIIGFIYATGNDIFEMIKNKFKKKDDEESIVIHEDKPKRKKKVKKQPEFSMVESIKDLDKLSENEEVKEKVITSSSTNSNYILPPMSLLKKAKKDKPVSHKIIEQNKSAIEQVLSDFGIIGKTVNVTSGPAVTQYELELEAGTKVNKLLSLNKEISLALAKKDVRIVAPIPGKSTVGIELANDYINPVSFKEMMDSLPEDKLGNPLLVALGKDINGTPIFCEIDKTPHLLVAGATGSGKSVCINGIISTLIMRTTPDQVKLVLIDPKKVEFTMYNNIPNLLMPVVTDPRKANVALQRLVNEMEKRYNTFSEYGVKNIAGYNELVERKNKNRGDDGKLEKMIYIVAIIDELADLMLVASKEVEDSIMRITQMARAAGIHLIVATQRPSTDIITGVVKANIPSRISFAVSSSIDSRTILDQTGAEKLLGKGDMLFLPMGENSPTRVQGAYVSDEEVEKLANFVAKQEEQRFSEELINLDESVHESGSDNVDRDDPLYNEIYDFVILNDKISTSKLQRKYKIGFNRASDIMDLLEERGVVGPASGTRPREVLINAEDE